MVRSIIVAVQLAVMVLICTTQNGTCRTPNYKNRIEDVYDLNQWQRNTTWFGDAIFGYLSSNLEERATIQKLLSLVKSGGGGNLGTQFDLTTMLMKGYFNMLPDYLRTPGGSQAVLGFLSLIQRDLAEEVVENFRNHTILGEMPYTSMDQSMQKRWLVGKVDWTTIILTALALQPYESFIPPGVDPVCYNDSANVLRSLFMGKEWALYMLDATGKPPVGITIGNLNWVGQYDYCHTIVGNRIFPNGNIKENDAFKGLYCHVEMPPPPGINIPTAPGQKAALRMGVCMPSTCKSNDVKLILEQLKTAAFGDYLPPIDRARCDSNSPANEGLFKTDGLAIAGSIGMGIVAAWVLLCTVIEGLFWYEGDEVNDLKVKVAKPAAESTKADKVALYSIEGHSNHGYESTTSHETSGVKHEGMGNGGSNGAAHGATTKVSVVEKESLIKRIVKIYSLYTNVQALLSTKQPRGTIKTLDALRVFNMNWIILGHIFSIGAVFQPHTMGAVFQPHTMANAKLASEKIKDWTFMGVFTGMLAVDSFFFISGLLVSYLFLKASTRNNGKWGMQLIMYYVHRFIRIIPLYAVLICVYVAFGQYLGSGPMFDWEDKKIKDCNKNWWGNLLFINNFVDPQNMCLGWSWYLSNDMQFYVIAPLILIPLYINKILGFLALGGVFVVHFVTTGVLWSRTEGRSYLQDPDIFYDAYITPYCRIGPYLVGLILGWIFYKGYKLPAKNINEKIVSWFIAIVLWLLAALLMGVIVYVQFEDVKDFGVLQPGWGTVQRTLYETFSRTGWAVSMAWIVYACNHGYGGFIGHILSWKGWGPLGKLTFSVYLVHPLVIFIYLSNRRDMNYVEDFSVSYMYSAYVLLSYLGGGILSLIFEWPSTGLEKLLFGNLRKPKSK